MGARFRRCKVPSAEDMMLLPCGNHLCRGIDLIHFAKRCRPLKCSPRLVLNVKYYVVAFFVSSLQGHRPQINIGWPLILRRGTAGPRPCGLSATEPTAPATPPSYATRALQYFLYVGHGKLDSYRMQLRPRPYPHVSFQRHNSPTPVRLFGSHRTLQYSTALSQSSSATLTIIFNHLQSLGKS